MEQSVYEPCNGWSGMASTLTVGERDINISGRLLRIAAVDGDKYRFLEHPGPVVEGLRSSGRRIDLFTFMQRVSETNPKYSFPLEWDNFAVLPISTFDAWWMNVLGFKGRNKAKQAEKKGVKVREIPFDNSLIEGIWRIYNECPIRQGKRFPHYGMPLAEVRPYAETFIDSSVFIGAFFEDTLIGFAKLTVDETRTQAGLMHIVSMVEHRDKAPNNALIAQAVKSCAVRQIPYLVYSNFAYGNKQRDSLSDFKERNGFQRVNVPRYYVPLTKIGELAFRVGLHHKLIDRLPETLIAKLRDYRAEWYNRKLQASLKVS
jgi:hypothetical protein